MSNRRRRGGRGRHRGQPVMKQVTVHAQHAAAVPMPKGTRAGEINRLAAGPTMLTQATDKQLAVELLRRVSVSAKKESYVIHARSKHAIVAVCHARNVPDAVDLEESIKALQRTYHPTNDQVKGRAADPVDREPVERVRRPQREYAYDAGVAGEVDHRDPIGDPMPRRGGAIQPRHQGPIDLNHPTRRGRVQYRGTPPPDQALDTAEFDTQSEYEE